MSCFRFEAFRNGILWVLATVVLFSGCDFSEPSVEQSAQNPFSEVGKIHNQGLDHALANLRSVDQPIRTQEERIKLLESSAQKFIRKRDLEVKGLDAAKMSRSLVRADLSQAKRKGKGSLLRLLPDSLRSALSAEQKRYIREILNVIESKPSKSELEDELGAIVTSAKEELNEERAKVVLSTAAVAKSSYRYWKEHLDEWRRAIIDTFPEPDSTVVRDRSASKMAKCTKKLQKIKVIHHPDGSTTTVYIYTCAGQDSGSNSGGGEGVMGSLADVATADILGGAGGAVAGSLLPEPTTSLLGAGGGAITGSTVKGGCEVLEGLGYSCQ